jgi:hypothetical protein
MSKSAWSSLTKLATKYVQSIWRRPLLEFHQADDPSFRIGLPQTPLSAFELFERMIANRPIG